jgi:hypothetical protein
MKRKKILGLLLVISLAALSFSAMILADSEDSSKSLQEGEDSPGAHQCPRDGYDINEGPANRNGFGEEY